MLTFAGIRRDDMPGRTNRGVPTNIIFSVSFQAPFNRAGGRAWDVHPTADHVFSLNSAFQSCCRWTIRSIK